VQLPAPSIHLRSQGLIGDNYTCASATITLVHPSGCSCLVEMPGSFHWEGASGADDGRSSEEDDEGV